jgi:Protein of unknown function (DUF3617)
VKSHFRPGPETVSAPPAARKTLAWLRLLPIIIGLASSTFLPVRIEAQVAPRPASDVDAGTIRPLDLKPGCWQMRITAIQPITLPRVTPDTYRATMPNATPKQLAEMVAQTNAQVDQQEAEARKPRIQTVAGCHPERVDLSRLIIGANGPANYKCTRTVRSTARELHLVQRCVSPDGKSNSEEATDFESPDPLNFTGTTRSVSNIAFPTDMKYVSKWIGEAQPHPPLATPTTDLDGVRPKGPVAVAGLDPYRIVASCEGKNWMAAQARAIFTLVPAQTVKDYGPRLDVDLQQIYMHKLIADEVLKKRIPISPKLKTQLAQAGIYDPDPQNPFGHVAVNFLDVRQRLEADRERILWDVYFDQAATEAEKHALLRQVQEKYKVAVVDPDFFAGTVNW